MEELIVLTILWSLPCNARRSPAHSAAPLPGLGTMTSTMDDDSSLLIADRKYLIANVHQLHYQ